MAAKLTTLTHGIPIQLHLVPESFIIRSSRSRRPVRKLLDTSSHTSNVFQHNLKAVNLKYKLRNLHCNCAVLWFIQTTQPRSHVT